MKRGLLSFVLLCLQAPSVFAFWDVSSQDDKTAIDFLESRGIVEGYEDGSYRPEASINRAELLTILLNSRDEEVADEVNCFTDVKNEWFAPVVCRAKEEGWVEGYADGSFGPGKNINRAEAIAMLFKVYADLVPLRSNSSISFYEDVATSSWYVDYLYTGLELGVLTERLFFKPSDDITRGDMASAVYRLLLVVEDENPFSGKALYVDPSSSAAEQLLDLTLSADEQDALQRIASEPTARWMGDWNKDIQSAANDYVTEVTKSEDLPVIVLYNIPGRDCGSYSAGGVSDEQAYLDWVSDFADGVGEREAVVIVEPDALSLDCLADRSPELLGQAVTILKSKPEISVYLDAGHPNWVKAAEMADRLDRANVDEADGFALNVSNFYTTEENIEYGQDISELVGGKHFVVDTSRNGKGWQGEWCNPLGASLGQNPTTDTGEALVDAFLWIKPPGESDGTCNGGPSAGSWWLEYALDLVWEG